MIKFIPHNPNYYCFPVKENEPKPEKKVFENLIELMEYFKNTYSFFNDYKQEIIVSSHGGIYCNGFHIGNIVQFKIQSQYNETTLKSFGRSKINLRIDEFIAQPDLNELIINILIRMRENDPNKKYYGFLDEYNIDHNFIHDWINLINEVLIKTEIKSYTISYGDVYGNYCMSYTVNLG